VGVEVVVVVVVVVDVVVVDVLVVVVMDVCVAVDCIQYKLLSTCPSKKLYLIGTAPCCRPGRLECIILF
jgi:hypothetical protein